jgi:hypothetical protein
MSIFNNLLKSSSKEDKFWSWVIKNKNEIINIPDDHSFIQQLIPKIKDYNQVLTFEIGGKGQGPLEFVISCDGISSGIPIVEKLVDSAPEIEGIRVIKFRQPKNDALKVQIGDLKISANDIFFLYKFDKNIHLQFFIPDYRSDDQRYAQITFILLDNLLGEYYVMTKIGEIDFQKIQAESDLSKMTRLSEINRVIKSLMN